MKWGRRAEVRLNPDRTVDEVVARGVSVHLEQMASGHWWLCLTRRDGEGLTINLSTARGAAIRCTVQSDNDSNVAAGFES